MIERVPHAHACTAARAWRQAMSEFGAWTVTCSTSVGLSGNGRSPRHVLREASRTMVASCPGQWSSCSRRRSILYRSSSARQCFIGGVVHRYDPSTLSCASRHWRGSWSAGAARGAASRSSASDVRCWHASAGRDRHGACRSSDESGGNCDRGASRVRRRLGAPADLQPASEAARLTPAAHAAAFARPLIGGFGLVPVVGFPLGIGRRGRYSAANVLSRAGAPGSGPASTLSTRSRMSLSLRSCSMRWPNRSFT
jgi:hypothetical protein